MKTLTRRRLLQALAALAALGVLPRRLHARAEAAFAASALDTALQALYGSRELVEHAGLQLEVPAAPDNPAQVPVQLRAAGLPPVHAFVLFAAANPLPLIARFELGEGVEPQLDVRIKVGGSGRLLLVAETAAGLFRTEAHVDAAAGACG
ncbi:thiosulfate oxidation carrier protein SoxY [Plasticicumulans acidivorans]|uniref:Thiosulfate-binding protein SoxY n=1 Tax=Plasticicumulans acidivorans TaxID=886464 RepID=A0A317MTF5_9GAMM|nr:thiosulfate oxidation carrier protein SoxY [Plasticicumulans acidivorans]PWV60212.1 thiosulfate-binding protein SoxY [Plasticicumulans acidivorans]